MGSDRMSSLSNLEVPNVQEFAATFVNSSKIPQRYIWPEAVAELVDNNFRDDLPVVDLERLLDLQLCQEESNKLEHACREWGFFQLVNHGISKELIEKTKADAVEFFKLSLEEKKRFAQLPNDFQGYGHSFVASEEQKLEWTDMLYLIARPLESRDMRFWPTDPPTFRDTFNRYSLASKEVVTCLFALVGKTLGIEPEVILNKFEDQPQALRVNYYPPCPFEADKVLGASSHTDITGMTVLLQVGEVQGLQIKKNDIWFPVDAIPDALIVFIGDSLEILSNGMFKAAEHRVTVNNRQERISIAAFHFPNQTAVIGPLPEVAITSSKKYKSMSFDDYLKTYIAARHDGRSSLESMKLD